MNLKEIEGRIRELERRFHSAMHGDDPEEVKRKLEEIHEEILALKRKKLDLIPNAREFVEFVERRALNLSFAVENVREEDVVEAVKLFLKVPLKHRKFALEMANVVQEAKYEFSDEEGRRLQRKWKKKVYRPLAILCGSSKLDLPASEKAKLLDVVLKHLNLSAVELKEVVEKDESLLALFVRQMKEGKLEDDEKVRLWLRAMQKK